MKTYYFIMIFIMAIFSLCSCDGNFVQQNGSNDNLEIIPDTLETDGWKSEEVANQMINGQIAVAARKYQKGMQMMTFEVIDSSLIPGAHNAFPLDQLKKAFDVDYKGEKAKMSPGVDDSSFVIIQHRQDERIFRIIGYGFKSQEKFLASAELIPS